MLVIFLSFGQVRAQDDDETSFNDYVFEFLKPVEERSLSTQIEHYVRVKNREQAVALAEQAVAEEEPGSGRWRNAKLRLLDVEVQFIKNEDQASSVDIKEELMRSFLSLPLLPEVSWHRADVNMRLASTLWHIERSNPSYEGYIQVEKLVVEARKIEDELGNESDLIRIDEFLRSIWLEMARLQDGTSLLYQILDSVEPADYFLPIRGVLSLHSSDKFVLANTHFLIFERTNKQNHLKHAVKLFNEAVFGESYPQEAFLYVTGDGDIQKGLLLVGLGNKHSSSLSAAVEEMKSNSYYSHLFLAFPELGIKLKKDIKTALDLIN